MALSPRKGNIEKMLKHIVNWRPPQRRCRQFSKNVHAIFLTNFLTGLFDFGVFDNCFYLYACTFLEFYEKWEVVKVWRNSPKTVTK